MDSAEEQAVCSHCNKEVVKTNLPMHEAHCQRFLCLCPDCDEQVPKEYLEQHREEQHAPVKCDKCKMKMEKCQLADHEANECTERLQTCEYCQLTLPLSSLMEHIVACGSRTERCPDCKQYVILKDQLHHSQICTLEDFSYKNQFVNGNVKPLLPNAMEEEEELGGYMPYDSRDQEFSQAAESFSEDTIMSLSDLQKKKQNEKMGWRDEDQIITCPHCHLALPVNTLLWHKDKCRLVEDLKRIIEKVDASK